MTSDRYPSLRELEVFRTLADSPTITEAAITLHMSQSQLSRILRELERRLGVILFERTTAGLRLTPEGQLFAHTTLAIRDTYSREMRTFSSRVAGETGEIRISILPSMAFEHLASWANAFRRRRPGATFTATDDISGSGIAAVISGDADVAISAARLRLPDRSERSLFAETDGARLTPLLTERFHLVAPARTELPAKPSWKFAFSRLSVGFTESTSVHRCLAIISAAEALDYSPETLTNSPLTIAGLVEAGFGWSVVPESNLSLMTMRELRTAELPQYERVVCVIVPEEQTTPLVEHFVDILMEG